MLVHLTMILYTCFMYSYIGIEYWDFKCPVQAFLNVLYSKNAERVH